MRRPTHSLLAALATSAPLVAEAFSVRPAGRLRPSGRDIGGPARHDHAGAARRAPSRPTVRLGLTPELGDMPILPAADMNVSRIAFWVFFVGAAGSAAIGRAVIPITWTKYWETQALAGQGTSLGGEDLGLFGYPEPVYSNDVRQVIENEMTIPEIVEAFPIENQIEGYLRYESLAKANPDANPLAVRAVFDSMAMGINKNQVAPRVAVQRLELFRDDLSRMKDELNKGRAVGVTALLLLLFVLGAADWLSFYHLWHGWFPLWPGPIANPASIPDYWVDQIPGY